MLEQDLLTSQKVEYDPELITTFAKQLYNKADWIILYHVLSYGLPGGFGAYLYTKDDAIGFFVGLSFSLLGYLLGQNKAFHYKLEAQVALCQVQIESNTRALTEARIEANDNSQSLSAKRLADF